MTTGQRIAAARKSKGLTQKQLSEQLNVSDKAVSRWERDESEPDIQSLVTLSGVLGTTVDALITDQKASDIPIHDTVNQPVPFLRPIMIAVFGSLLSIIFATIIDPIIPGGNWGYLPFILCSFSSLMLVLSQPNETAFITVKNKIWYAIILISLAAFTLPAAFSTDFISIIGLGVLLAEIAFVLSIGIYWFLITPILKRRNLLPNQPDLTELRKTTTFLYILALVICIYAGLAAGFYEAIYIVAAAFLTVPITILTVLLYRKAKK